MITTKFCTWHNSCAVVAYAKFINNLVSSNRISRKILPSNLNWEQNIVSEMSRECTHDENYSWKIIALNETCDLNFDKWLNKYNSLRFYLCKNNWIHIMAWFWIYAKPLSTPIIIQFNDTNIYIPRLKWVISMILDFLPELQVPRLGAEEVIVLRTLQFLMGQGSCPAHDCNPVFIFAQTQSPDESTLGTVLLNCWFEMLTQVF